MTCMQALVRLPRRGVSHPLIFAASDDGSARLGSPPALDIRSKVGDNREREGCHPSGHEGDPAEVLPLPVAEPMWGSVLVLGAIALLIAETKQMHHWPGARGGVASTSSARGATHGPVCMHLWPPRCAIENGKNWHVQWRSVRR